jgi:hypothetical protein
MITVPVYTTYGGGYYAVCRGCGAEQRLECDIDCAGAKAEKHRLDGGEEWFHVGVGRVVVLPGGRRGVVSRVFAAASIAATTAGSAAGFQ